MRLKILDKNHFTPTKLYIIVVGQRISFSCLEGFIIDELDQRFKSKGESERETRSEEGIERHLNPF